MFHDEDILYDELTQRRSDSGSARRKRLRLPLHAPGRHHDEDAEAKTDEETSDRGVRVLDMNQGYAVVD